MNPISKYWLNKRQSVLKSYLKNSIVLDVGSRTEKIITSAIGLDLQRTTDIQADGCHLPFRNHSIETIIASEFIEHLNYPQLESFISEVQRTSKHLVLSTPNCDSPSWHVFWHFWKHTFGRGWKDTHISLFCNEGLLSFFGTHNLSIVESRITRWSLFYHLTVNQP